MGIIKELPLSSDYKLVITEELIMRDTFLGRITRDIILDSQFAETPEDYVEAVGRFLEAVERQTIKKDPVFAGEFTNAVVKINEQFRKVKHSI